MIEPQSLGPKMHPLLPFGIIESHLYPPIGDGYLLFAVLMDLCSAYLQTRSGPHQL
jgi:hypothetical protein